MIKSKIDGKMVPQVLSSLFLPEQNSFYKKTLDSNILATPTTKSRVITWGCKFGVFEHL